MPCHHGHVPLEHKTISSLSIVNCHQFNFSSISNLSKMSPLHDPSFMAHFAQCKVSAKQQVNSMIDAIYAKVLLDLELWLNKHQSNDSIKSDSDCEENVTHHNNLPGESQFDLSTEAENDHLQNEVSLSDTINTESVIKQEFNDNDGEEIDDENVAKCEKCENGICIANTETSKNGDISSDTTQPNQLIKQQCLQGSTITSIPLDFTNNAELNDISIDEFDDSDDDDDDYNEVVENEYLNQANSANRVSDFDNENNNNHFNSDVPAGDEDETNFDEAQFDIDINVTNNTQINSKNDGENDNNEKCVSERNMEQSTPSTSGVRSSTRKRIQTKVFGDLVQSNGNSRNSAKRKSDQVNESVKKVKRKNVLDDDEETDSGDQEEHATSAIGEEIATECTTNPIQANFAQPNRHLQCSHCNKSFVSKSTLQRHLRVHTGERPFECDQCGKRFKHKNDLAKHQLIHRNIKPYQCDQCDKQFTQKVNLERHLRMHTGERPHQCRFCAKSFARFQAMNIHEKAIHLHVKPYRCKQCAHTATHRSDIIVHIRVVHFGLPQTIKQQRALNIIDHRDPRELLEKV